MARLIRMSRKRFTVRDPSANGDVRLDKVQIVINKPTRRKNNMTKSKSKKAVSRAR